MDYDESSVMVEDFPKQLSCSKPLHLFIFATADWLYEFDNCCQMQSIIFFCTLNLFQNAFVLIFFQHFYINIFIMFQVSLSVVFTAVGVIIAALGDFSFDLFGYSMALTSVFFQVYIFLWFLLYNKGRKLKPRVLSFCCSFWVN